MKIADWFIKKTIHSWNSNLSLITEIKRRSHLKSPLFLSQPGTRSFKLGVAEIDPAHKRALCHMNTEMQRVNFFFLSSKFFFPSSEANWANERTTRASCPGKDAEVREWREERVWKEEGENYRLRPRYQRVPGQTGAPGTCPPVLCSAQAAWF